MAKTTFSSRSKAKYTVSRSVLDNVHSKILYANTTMGNSINVLESDVSYMEKNLWYGGERSAKTYENLRKSIASCRELYKKLDDLSNLLSEMIKKLPQGG